MTHARYLYCFKPHYDAFCVFLHDVHTDHVLCDIRPFETVDDLKERDPDHITVIMMDGMDTELPESVVDYLADHPSTVLCSVNANNHKVVRYG